MPTRPISKHSTLPFALYLQATPHGRLHLRADREMKAGDEDWVKANPREAKRLDAMIGSRVTLARTFDAIGSKIKPWPAGTEFTVVARWHDHLIGKTAKGTYLKLRDPWLRKRTD